MAPRSTPPPLAKGSFHPPSDAATYRDLLLFEERLKTTAASLQRRKSRYLLFLAQLLVVIAFLLSEVLLQTSFLAIPYRWVLHRLLPDIYYGERLDAAVVHPYFSSGMLFVGMTTLILVFASGMYREKIGYANRYVPQANRALRSFNMYLNVRRAPLRSSFLLNPLSILFPRPKPHPTPTPTPSSTSTSTSTTSTSPAPAPIPTSTTPDKPRSASPTHRSRIRPPTKSTSVPITPIPPTTNPRGELIFSSRVDRGFREGYERYRAAFERRREERERAVGRGGWRGWVYGWWPWARAGGGGVPGASGSSVFRSSSFRGRGESGHSTPEGSRKSSPAPRGAGEGRSTPPVGSMRGPRADGSMRTSVLEKSVVDYM